MSKSYDSQQIILASISTLKSDSLFCELWHVLTMSCHCLKRAAWSSDSQRCLWWGTDDPIKSCLPCHSCSFMTFIWELSSFVHPFVSLPTHVLSRSHLSWPSVLHPAHKIMWWPHPFAFIYLNHCRRVYQLVL